MAVEAPRYHGRGGGEAEACKAWRLDVADVEQLFQLSEHYDSNPYHLYYQVSCAITGQLFWDGRSWDFAIDGGGTATWTNGSETRYLGCAAPACEPYVMLLTDMMSP